MRRSDGGSKCASLTYESGSGRPDVLTVRKTTACTSGTVLATFDLGYDAASNVSSRAETITGNSFGGTYTYTYDAANRLLSASGPAAFGSRTYAYDGAGNRTSVQVGTGTPTTTSYDGAGLPTSSSDGTTYTHDQIGDLTVIDRPGGMSTDWRSTYSSWGKLTKAEHTAGSSDVTYALDALDRVLSRTAASTTSAYSYSGLGEDLAKAVAGATTTLYASTPGGPLAQKVGSTIRYYIRDQHGDLVGDTDTTGTLQGTILYDPWGQPLSGTGDLATTPAQGAFRFQSDLADASTGQVDMLTRLYEPSLGRFSSRDVLFGEPRDPITLNQFVYGGSSPVTFSDPTGMYIVGTDTHGTDCGTPCERASGVAVESNSCSGCSPAVAMPEQLLVRSVAQGLSRFGNQCGFMGWRCALNRVTEAWDSMQEEWWQQATETRAEVSEFVADHWTNVVTCGIAGSQYAESAVSVAWYLGWSDLAAATAAFAVGCVVGWHTPPTPPA
jgi:RHS repeat-associated protein